MSSTGLAPVTSPAGQDHDDDLTHYYCCDWNRALCGIDLTDVPMGGSDDLLCVVCTDLNGRPCRTGCTSWCRP